jgi:hypothetical protein
MPIAFPNFDKPGGLSGGADAWDDGPGGVILCSDFFAEPAPSGGGLITFTAHGPFDNQPGAQAAAVSTSISYAAGQPIIVEAGASATLTISDTAGLTWQLLDASLPLYFAANQEYQYVWYAIPASSGSTAITVTRASSGSYFGFMVATYESGAGTPLLVSTGSIGAYTASAEPFSNTITPTTSGSAVWTHFFTGGGSGPPAMDSGSAIYESHVIAGNRTQFRLGKTTEPLTSNSAVTISGLTDTGFQYAQWINYEVPSTSVGGGGGAVVACSVGEAAAAGVSAQVSASLVTAVGAATAASVSARVSATLATAIGASTAAGVSAQVSATLVTAVAAASATGASASISTAGSTVITCAVGAAAAAGVSAQVSATLVTAVAAATATGVSASISAAGSTVIPCTVAAASATGVGASINVASSTVITCAVGAAAAAGVSAQVSATLVTAVAAASSTGASASISTPGTTVITCAVGAAAAVGVAGQISATIRPGVGAATAAGVSVATGLRLAATVGDGTATGVLAQLQFSLSTVAGAASALGVPFIPRSSNDILPGALVGNRSYVDTTRPAQQGAARPMQQGAARPMQQGAARPPRIARTTR